MMKTVIALAALMAATPASANMVEIKWDGNGKFAHDATVNPGSMAEICGGLNKGTVVDWYFDASAPMDFNIHYHVKGGAEYPAKLDGVSKAGNTLNVQIDQGYCWMWENKGAAPATLRLELQKKL